LKEEVKTLRDKIPQEFLEELSEVTSSLLDEKTEEEKEPSEECLSREDEEFL